MSKRFRRALRPLFVFEPVERRLFLAHIAVIGDFSSDNQTAPTRDVANLVKGWNPDLVATVGDNNYPDGAASTIDDNVGQWYHQFISPYTGSYGGGASTNEFFPSLGNHDYNSSQGYKPYTDYFNLPNNERYYTTTDGNLQIFVVNSDSHEPDGTSQNSKQATWLKNALASSTAKWKLVLFHHPAYSSGGIGSNNYMQWPFQQWGASAVISGHDHDYERIDKGGFPYFVDGLGGESIVGWGSTVSGSQVRYNGDYGAMLIDTTSTTMTFKFINRSGGVIDNYTLGSTSTAPSAPTNLSAVAMTSTQAKLTWTDASPSLSSSFKIERSTNGGSSFTQIATTIAGVTTYTDSGLSAGATYVYRVRASNSVGDSPYSNTSSVTLPTGSTTYVSDMTWVSSTNGWGPVERDTSVGSSGSNDGNTITLNGVTYPKGLGAHANSTIVINLNKQYGTFLSDVGVDDETGPGTVVFQVWGDGVKLYDSGTMTQTGATKSVSVNVSNVSQLTLTVTDAGDGNSYDHADWAAARLQSASASQPPSAPTGVTATAVSPTQINVTWNDVINESGYRIERSTDGTTFSPVGATGANVVSFADTSVSGSTLYSYRVIATSASGDSSPSNVDTARPLQVPSAPSNLAAAAASANQIDLSWVINDTNTEESFKIERSPNGTSNWAQIANIPESETYSDTTVAGSTTYFYRVRASNLAGDSGYSNVASATTPAATTSPTLIATGSIWKYLDNGSNQGTAWRALAFDDSAWKSGPAQLGYGDGDEATVVSYGSNANNKFVTTYFRRNFSVADKTQVTALALRLVRDDGAVVYLNGTEVYRSNMPTGTISSSTFASTAVGGADESTFFSASVSPSLLVNGNNVIAVEIHQSDAASSDISFDFGLTATLSSGGGVTAPSAPSGLSATAASSSQINLTWIDTSSNESGFNVYRSTDGTTFAKVGSSASGATSYGDTSGLVASTKYYYKVRAFNSGGESGDSSIASATTLAGTSSLPAPWVDADVGSVGAAGSASFNGTTYTVKGSGSDIWTAADGFHFVYQQLTGDGTIIARVASVQNTNGWAKAGVMMRESLAAGAKEASVHVTPANGVVMTFRTATGAASDGFFTSGSAPQWLKLVRSGGTFTSYKSSDGVTWSQVGTMTISMASTIYVGLDVSSKANTTLNTSMFTNVSVTPGAPALAPMTSLSATTTTTTTTTTRKNDLLDLLA